MTESVETVENADQVDQGVSPNAEAAKYRRRLREVEVERDGLAAMLTSARDNLLQARIAGLRAADGSHLRESEYGALNTEGLFGDDGALNADELESRFIALQTEKAHYFEGARGPIIPSQGTAPNDAHKSQVTFESAFAPQDKD